GAAARSRRAARAAAGLGRLECGGSAGTGSPRPRAPAGIRAHGPPDDRATGAAVPPAARRRPHPHPSRARPGQGAHQPRREPGQRASPRAAGGGGDGRAAAPHSPAGGAGGAFRPTGGYGGWIFPACQTPPQQNTRRIVLLAITLVAAPAAGRAQAISQGFELERQGHADQAATLYFGVLRGEPANLPALLGLERVLTPLGRIAELLPLAEHALTVDTTSAVRSVALRTYTALDMRDSAAALVRRWVAARPGELTPWREWAIALEDRQRFEDARNVLLLGRRTLGTPGALAIELAELGQRTGDWQTAAFEWAGAADASPSQLANA